MKPFDFHAGEMAGRRTVVLLHSSASSSRQWSALVELLGPRFDVRTVDFYGHGTQPAWRGERALTLADEVALVEPVLREAGPVHLVGHSYGGAVALKVAEAHPHQVRSLVVYEPVLYAWLFKDAPHDSAAREVREVSDAVGQYVATGQDHAAAAVFVDYWSGVGEWENMHPARQNAIAARMRAVNPHFAAAYREPFASTSSGALQMPILYLTGENTADSTSRISVLARRALPFAEHDTLPGMGHMGPITHAPEFNRRLWTFLMGDRATLGVDTMHQFAEEAVATL